VQLSPRVVQALSQLGEDLRDLRRRRRMPMDYVCQIASISRSTLHKIERGDPGVSLGIYATIVSRYGLLERLEFLVNVRYDLAGLALEKTRLPRRILACQVSSRPHPTIRDGPS
jgi:transcriptional regulator with XRE-family HTH domain